MQTIHVTQTKGGVGASTFRVALALVAAREGLTVALVGDQEDHAALCGLAASFVDTDDKRSANVNDKIGIFADYDHWLTENPQGSNFDLMIADGVASADYTLAVYRPCYLALRHGVHRGPADIDGVVLFDEPQRSLGARDVANVLGVPIIATVQIRSAVSRAIDAGVLPTRLPDALARPALEALRRMNVTFPTVTVDEDGDGVGPNGEHYGHCDTCGAACDANGCTVNRNHEVAVA